jgi:hypothetical protein
VTIVIIWLWIDVPIPAIWLWDNEGLAALSPHFRADI